MLEEDSHELQLGLSVRGGERERLGGWEAQGDPHTGHYLCHVCNCTRQHNMQSSLLARHHRLQPNHGIQSHQSLRTIRTLSDQSSLHAANDVHWATTPTTITLPHVMETTTAGA